MLKKISRVACVIIVVLCAGGAAWVYRSKLVGIWHKASDVSTDHDGGGREAHGEHAHHEGHADAADHEEENAADLAMSVEEILNKRCEHDMPTYQCDECRYEVGVVKVDKSIRKDNGTQSGLVGSGPVSRSKVIVALNVTGEVQLDENAAIHISPRISGVIRSVQVDMGQQVAKDDVLFEIESVELGQALSEAEKNRAMVELSRKNFEREKSLYERKIASERDMIEVQMTYEQYQIELKAAEQKLRILGLTDKAMTDVGNGSVGRLPTRAPLSGTIIEKHAVIGELVEPGRDVMLLAELRTVWVWADIYERDLAALLDRQTKGKTPIEIAVHAFPERVFRGEIDYIGATMEEKTRTVKVRATVQNEDRLLRPGMFCEIRVLLTSDEEVTAIPKSALLSDDGRDFVFQHLKDDYYVRRAVKKGREFDDRVEILEGLTVGETIVVHGAFLLKSDVLRSKMGAGCAD